MRPRKAILRFALATVMAFLGTLIASLALTSNIPYISRLIIVSLAAASFGVLGLILPEALSRLLKIWFAKLRAQIKKLIISNYSEFASLAAGPLRFARRRKKKKTASKYLNPILVDTSVLVDGRIGDIAKSGFIGGTMLIIPSVITELHQLADSKDDLKRIRGRRGLDILEAIRTFKNAKVEVLEWEPDKPKVDDKLIDASKKLKAGIMTVDFNLGKVARVRGIDVLNINELANAVKTVILPSEELTIAISAAGKGKDQGVGFLDDGTMVVVEGGASFVGQELRVRVNKVLQTAAGKMIFARKAF